ncbi:hypothetical protein K3495_g636 [Podosphaera aphanis]|nr:hypothetical protein K3495_g636 [Podosphaera aphanis]
MILQGDNLDGEATYKELPYSQHAVKLEFVDFDEEPIVPSTVDKDPTELIHAKIEFIPEPSTIETKESATVAASLKDPALSTIDANARKKLVVTRTGIFLASASDKVVKRHVHELQKIYRGHKKLKVLPDLSILDRMNLDAPAPAQGPFVSRCYGVTSWLR